jgi:hypothetical protein
MIAYIFIDGIGFGEKDSAKNPFTKFASGFFLPLGGKEPEDGSIFQNCTYLKIDPSMGIKGLPQSATGQTALWTGINAPRVVGRHISGFPSFTLKKIINEYSVIKIFEENGYKASFINCYNPKYIEHIEKNPKHISASTMVQLAAKKSLNTFDDLREGRGLYMDINHLVLKEYAKDILSSDDPLLQERDPYKMGKLFCEIVSNYDLSIYEFFLTDKVGHDQNWDMAKRVIHTVEAFMNGIIENFPKEKGQLILSSDHGNLEDLSVGTHTTNLVPCFLYGKHTEEIKHTVKALCDIVPAIYSIYDIDCKPTWEPIEQN